VQTAQRTSIRGNHDANNTNVPKHMQMTKHLQNLFTTLVHLLVNIRQIDKHVQGLLKAAHKQHTANKKMLQ